MLDMLKSTGHFIVTCPLCGDIVAQCRCVGPKNERVADEPCEKCAAKLERKAARREGRAV